MLGEICRNAEAVVRYYPHQLSGGMLQRVMIAMALSCEPQVLIADEPTTALDVTIQAQILQLIKDIQAESGMGLVMITHDLGVIAETVDRVVVLYGGKVMETGPVEAIFDAPAIKLLARHEQLGPQDFWDRAEAVVGVRVEITWSSRSTLLEISAHDVTKASTLGLLCAELGIDPADVVAFGDMPNDLPLLAWAGTSYAMANAHPTVLEAAARVAPANDDDGVAQVLEQLLA